MFELPLPTPANNFYQSHIQLLAESFQRLLGRPLMVSDDDQELGRRAFEADFVLLSHNTDADPLFNYANRKALELFEFSWAEFIGMPSRLSAEPVNRDERQRLLEQVTSKGFIDNYSGVRVAHSGRRFLIDQAVVWNVYDNQENYCGQAACFSRWRLLP